MTSPLIRPTTSQDLPTLAAVLAALPLFAAYGLDAAALEGRWRQALTQGDSLLTALLDSGPVGLCWFIPRGCFGTGAYLRLLALAPQVQAQGLGSQLLQAFEKASAAPGGWFLLASHFNHDAHRFYARHGYAEVGRLPDFAKPGITECIMWKPPARRG